MFQILLVACLQFEYNPKPVCDRVVMLQYQTQKACQQDLQQWQQQAKVRWVGCVWERLQES